MTRYDLDFCTLELYDNYMKAIINEGVTLSFKYNSILTEICDTYYKNQPFVYISHRINSYSVDPIIYLKTGQIKNLIAFIIVSDNPMQKMLTQLEKSFFKKEFRHFETLEEALEWKDKILGK